MTGMKRLAALIAVLSLASCGATRDPGCPALADFDPKKAAADATAAKDRGERFLLGVHGYADMAPDQTDRTLSVHYIEGTSDTMVGQNCANLNQRALEYASRFNVAMQARPR
jgi:hypothetical protein